MTTGSPAESTCVTASGQYGEHGPRRRLRLLRDAGPLGRGRRGELRRSLRCPRLPLAGLGARRVLHPLRRGRSLGALGQRGGLRALGPGAPPSTGRDRRRRTSAHGRDRRLVTGCGPRADGRLRRGGCDAAALSVQPALRSACVRTGVGNWISFSTRSACSSWSTAPSRRHGRACANPIRRSTCRRRVTWPSTRSDIVFVGDSWEPDVRGPRRMGMTAVHVWRADEHPGRAAPTLEDGDHRVADFRGVLDVLAVGSDVVSELAEDVS